MSAAATILPPADTTLQATARAARTRAIARGDFRLADALWLVEDSERRIKELEEENAALRFERTVAECRAERGR